MTDAERQRRRRRRLAEGRAVLPVEVDAAALAEKLIAARWLSGWDREDRAAIAAAVSRLLAHLIRHA